MKAREVGMGVVAVLTAAGCIRLGFWQLGRLEQRRTKNALVAAQTTEPAVSVAQARMQDTSRLHWRRMTFRGIPNYEKEVVLSARSQSGTVGVQIVTPVRPLDSVWPDTSILLIRGWMPAADGRSYTRQSTPEGDTITVDALVTHFPTAGTGVVRMPSTRHAFRWLNRDTISTETGSALAPFVLLQLGDTVQRDVAKIVRV
ncbi:MAG: SURF1 family protein, partial [Phycisphaerae bacterium]|nr:SURF1 family protein [Gemmatimonadaceae bacterium]